MNIGQAIRVLRTKHGMTQAALAEKVGMSVNAVSSWELGKTQPPRDSIRRICDAFGVPEAYINLASVEEADFPEAKRVLYRANLEPMMNELLEDEGK